MRKKHLLVITITMLLLSLAVIKPSAAQPGQITVKVTDDTHVDSTNPDSILGEQKYLDIESWGDASTSYHQIVWLKFSLSAVPDGAEFNQATLKVYAWFIGGTFNVTAHYCSDNSWTESTLTYSNMPNYDTNPIDTVLVSEDGEWYSWNAVEAVRRASDSNAQSVTIVLSEPMLSTQNSVFMYSKETPSLVMDVSPTLTLSWSGTTLTTPTPTTTPSPTLATSTPAPTSTPASTPTPTTTSGESNNWAIWAALLVVILITVFLSGYILTKRKRRLPPPPPPPP